MLNTFQSANEMTKLRQSEIRSLLILGHGVHIKNRMLVDKCALMYMCLVLILTSVTALTYYTQSPSAVLLLPLIWFNQYHFLTCKLCLSCVSIMETSKQCTYFVMVFLTVSW